MHGEIAHNINWIGNDEKNSMKIGGKKLVYDIVKDFCITGEKLDASFATFFLCSASGKNSDIGVSSIFFIASSRDF